MALDQQPVIVDTKSPWYSKVNWIAGLTALVATATEVLPIVPPAYQHYVTTFVIVAGGLLTIITKTFYTPTISSSSVPPCQPVSLVTVSATNFTEETKTAALNLSQAAKPTS